MDRSKQVISSCENELTRQSHYIFVPAMPVFERYYQLIASRSDKIAKFLLHRDRKTQRKKLKVAFRNCQCCERLMKPLDIGNDITNPK